MPHNLIVILGPTASGKTRMAARLARDLNTEIISADSRQVYRGMDIGTGKDLSQYVVDGVAVACHLIDVVDPSYEFSVFEYQKRFFQHFRDIRSRAMLPIMCGGTGLYLEAVLLNYRMAFVAEDAGLREELEFEDTSALRSRLLSLNTALHNTTDLRDRRRIIRAIEIAQSSLSSRDQFAHDMTEVDPLVIGIRWERAVLRRRITERLHDRLGAGLVDEVRRLYECGLSWEKLDSFGLEYRFVSLFLRGETGYAQMVAQLNVKIHQFAKRQETWFRRMERRGVEINWVDGDDYEAVRNQVYSAMA